MGKIWSSSSRLVPMAFILAARRTWPIKLICATKILWTLNLLWNVQRKSAVCSLNEETSLEHSYEIITKLYSSRQIQWKRKSPRWDATQWSGNLFNQPSWFWLSSSSSSSRMGMKSCSWNLTAGLECIVNLCAMCALGAARDPVLIESLIGDGRGGISRSTFSPTPPGDEGGGHWG